MLISGKHKDFSGIDYFYLKFDDFLKVLIWTLLQAHQSKHKQSL
jgi:hypothetical protein